MVTQSLAVQLRVKRSEMMASELEAVALRLFEERGFGEVTVEDIALEAHISVRTFYRYFPGKEDVLQLQIDQINATMTNHGFIVRLTDDAKQWILAKTCADRSYGARPLRRALQKNVEDPLSEALIQGQLGEASLVEMFVDGEQLSFRSFMVDEAGIEQPIDLLLTH